MSATLTVRMIFDWLRRRFWIIALPILLSVPLAVTAAMVLPRSYIASTLLLLQESSTEGPFSRELRSAESVGDKISALQALLHSEHTLNEILVELHGSAIRSDSRRLFQAREDLRRAVTLSASGPEFITIRYRSNGSLGMGRTLEIITARLLQTVLSSDLDAPPAPKLVLSRMEKRLMEVERDLSAFDASPLIQALGKASNVPTDVANRELPIRKFRLAEVENALFLALRASPRLAAAPGSIAREVAALQLSLTRTTEDGGADSNAAGLIQSQIQALSRAAELESSYFQLRQEVDLVQFIVSPMAAGQNGLELVQAQRRRLQARVDEFRQDFTAWQNRFGNVASRGLSFMRAPERIVVIDPPRDPDVAQTSRAFLVFIGIALGVILGFGLALLVELLDPPRRKATFAGGKLPSDGQTDPSERADPPRRPVAAKV